MLLHLKNIWLCILSLCFRINFYLLLSHIKVNSKLSYSLTSKMLRPAAFTKRSQQAFSFSSNLSKVLGSSKKQVVYSMSWQILCGTRVSFSVRGCTIFWWADDSPCRFLWQKCLQPSLPVRNFRAPFSFRCGKRKMWDVFPRLRALGVCCQCFFCCLAGSFRS